MKLTGLDFETANFRSGSICSVGCAVVEDGAVTQTMGCLVRPHKSMNYVNDVCYDTHGINWFCLQKATEFPQVWEELRPLLTVSDCVVIHNAPFDLRHKSSQQKKSRPVPKILESSYFLHY